MYPLLTLGRKSFQSKPKFYTFKFFGRTSLLSAFKNHVDLLCKKANDKIHESALAWVKLRNAQF